MKRLFKFLLLLALSITAWAIPISAQEGVGGQGGIIIEGTSGGDPTTLDPLLSSDATTAFIQALALPAFIGVNPVTASFEPNQSGAIVSTWDVSEDGQTYTFYLRQDMFWNDGDLIDADDVMYAYNAIASGQIESPLAFALDSVTSVEKLDQFTIRVVFSEPNCDALQDASILLAPYPSHVAPANFADLPNSDYGRTMTPSQGPFKFGELRAGEAITLLADQTYVDATLGYVNPTGYVILNVPDLTVNVERFLAGEINFIDGPQESRRVDIYAAEERGEVQVFRYPGNSWDYLMFNLADPTNPRNGLDENGNYQDQGIHPIFGGLVPDATSESGWRMVGKEVRQALNYALDIDAIGERAAFGEVTRIPAMLVPSSWAYHTELEPRPYDLEKAKELLDAAGWVNSDPNDPSSVRVCQGCSTAPDGTEMRFNLITNEENARRTAVITLAQEAWSSIGVKAEIQTLEFFTMIDILDTQTFDSVVAGWQNGYPDRPDQTQIFTPAGDVVGGGSNDMSWYNPEFVQLNAQARSLPGCDQDARRELYWRMQEIAQDETPYIFLWARNGLYAARSTVEGFDPFASAPRWNVDVWSVNTSE